MWKRDFVKKIVQNIEELENKNSSIEYMASFNCYIFNLLGHVMFF